MLIMIGDSKMDRRQTGFIAPDQIRTQPPDILIHAQFVIEHIPICAIQQSDSAVLQGGPQTWGIDIRGSDTPAILRTRLCDIGIL